MNTTAQVKQAIKKSAKQIKQEPLEILKNIGQQVSGDELPQDGGEEYQNQEYTRQDTQHEEEQKLKAQVAEQDGRRLQALEAELRDMRRLKLYNKLMRIVQSGEDIPVEEFQELSSEQREVLKAQMEIVNKQKQGQQNQQPGLVIPASKPGRQLRFGQKQSAQQQTTRVEKPLPPSG